MTSDWQDDSPKLVTCHSPLVTALRKAGFGLFRVRSPLLTESLLLSLPPGTEMVHFPGLARTRLWIQRAVIRVRRIGLPHSEILGSKGASPSPRLFAGSRVLHRRLAPRHPPYALSSLTIKSAQHTNAAVSYQWSVVSQDPCCRPLPFTAHSSPSTALLRKFAFYLSRPILTQAGRTHALDRWVQSW